jgi:tight adherence protein B
MPLLIAFATFFIATLVSFLVWFSVTTDTRQQIVQRRIEAVQRTERRGNLTPGVQLVRDETMSTVPALNRFMMQSPWSIKFRDFVTQAGIRTRPGKIVLASAVSAFLGYVIARAAYANFPLAVLIGLAAGSSLFIYVAIVRVRRLRRFEEHFPEALDLLNRAIRAGHAFTVGLGMIASEAPEPIAEEFKTAFEEQNFGLPLRDALENLAERVPLIDVRFFVTALMIQRETGGNLSELLDNLAHVIRDRFRLYREARSKSAHGRLTAGILIALPPLMVVGLGVMNPHYMEVLYDDPLGPYILWGAAIWQIIGAALLWRIVHIEV